MFSVAGGGGGSGSEKPSASQFMLRHQPCLFVCVIVRMTFVGWKERRSGKDASFSSLCA